MGYDSPPWTFKGRALYQLQLVPVSEARKHVPEQFKLVELFGHTLGGFFLARYDDSPAGAFDELVALAGLVWNSPLSCAWAARVYVSNREAMDHGLHHVGLPSRLATFTEAAWPSATSKSSRHSSSWWKAVAGPLDKAAPAPLALSQSEGARALQVASIDCTPRSRGVALPVASFMLPPAKHHMAPFGPRLTLFLPSFSGNTLHVPELLKYSCRLETNLRLTSAALTHTFCEPALAAEISSSESSKAGKKGKAGKQPVLHVHHSDRELLGAVFGGRPLLAMAFDNMVMQVEQPTQLAKPDAASGATSQGKSPGWGQAKLATISQSLLTLIPITHLPTSLRL